MGNAYIIKDKQSPVPRYIGVHHDHGTPWWWFDVFRAKPFGTEEQAFDWASERLHDRTFEVIAMARH